MWCPTTRVCRSRTLGAAAIVSHGLCFETSSCGVVAPVCPTLTVSTPGSPVNLLSPSFLLDSSGSYLSSLKAEGAVPPEHLEYMFSALAVHLLCGPWQFSEVFLLCLSIPLLPAGECLVEAGWSEKTELSFAAFKGNLPLS